MTTQSFSESYAVARAKFLAAASSAGARLSHYRRDDVRGAEGEELSCDVAVLGAERAERAALVITGTHGVEGFCGSAVLHRWLTAHWPRASVRDVTLVVVHALNAWGFSHKARTTENNVDLNRNFLRAGEHRRDNASYDKLVPFLHAERIDAADNLEAHRQYKTFLDEHGWQIENEMLEGQSHRPDGLFYSGAQPEWANLTFRKIINTHLTAAASVGFIDWHTGVGSHGQIVHLIFSEQGSAEHAAATSWWNVAPAGGAFNSGTIPRYRGLVCGAIQQELPRARIAGAVTEFGTMDEYLTFRTARLGRWLSFEGRADPQRGTFVEDYKDAFYPRDTAWRNLVMRDGPAIMDRLIEGVRSWGD